MKNIAKTEQIEQRLQKSRAAYAARINAYAAYSDYPSDRERTMAELTAALEIAIAEVHTAATAAAAAAAKAHAAASAAQHAAHAIASFTAANH